MRRLGLSRIDSGPASPKSLTYRNPKLLAAIRKAPYCFHCFKVNQGDLQAAHGNVGKGLSIKSTDSSCAALCPSCHRDLDQGKNMTRAERQAMHYEANARTLRWLIEEGYLVLAE